ncbi:Collectin-11 [Branchiostoma belcheri]|nr:Collectin-11 [Branchiostoma belcheri]
MDVKAVLVMLAVLMPLLQSSGKAANLHLYIGSYNNARGSDTADKSQEADNIELLKQKAGLFQDTSQLETLLLDMADTGRNKKMQEQIKELQKQVKDLPDLKNQVKNLTADLCVIKQACCNKTLAVCPCGYERFSERPGMCYKFSPKSDFKIYADARSSCQADGGHLAMPKDKATNDFLAKQIRARDYIFDHAWFGLTDQVQERTWVWEDGTPLGTGWNNWAQGPPAATFNMMRAYIH